MPAHLLPSGLRSLCPTALTTLTVFSLVSLVSAQPQNPPPGPPQNPPLNPPNANPANPSGNPEANKPATPETTVGAATYIVYDFGGNRLFVRHGNATDKDGTPTDQGSPFTGHTTVRDNSFVAFKIENVNKFLYNVTIKGERKEFNQDIPGAFKTAFLPSAAPTKAASSFVEATPLRKEYEEYKRKLTLFNDQVNSLIQASQMDEEFTTIGVSYPVLSAGSISNIKNQVKEAAYKIVKVSDPALPNPVSSSDIRKSREAFLSKIEDSYNALKEEHDTLLSTVETLKPPKPEDYRTGVEYKQALDKQQAALKEVNDPFNEATDLYNKVQASNKRPSADQPSELEKKFSNAASLYEFVVNGNAFQSTGSTRAGGDEVKVTYEIKPKDAFRDDKNLQTVSDDVSVPVFGGFHIDFSAGVFLSELTNQNIVTRSRTVTENGAMVTQKFIVDKGSDDITFPVGALAHIYTKVRRPWLGLFQPAVSVGAAVAGSNTQYIVGGSAIFGRQRRAIVTIGYAWGPVTRLAPGLKVGGIVPEGQTDITNSVTKGDLIFGFTFNLTP